MRPRLAPALWCLLLAAVPPTPAQGERIAITSVKVTGWENLPATAADTGAWVRRFTESWRGDYGAWVELTDARPAGPGAAAAAELEVAITADGFRTRVALAPPSGRRLEARASIHGHLASALLPALAGDLFFLWAQAGAFALPPAREAPPLAALLALDSLRLLPGWRPEASEPLDCAAAAQGPVLLFSDRLLALDRDLDIAPATVGDLLLRPAFPAGFRPDRLWLDPLGQPLLFSAATGETLTYLPGFPPERRETGMRQPVHAAALPKGGLAVLASGRVTRILRRGGGVTREPLPLPGGFYAAVEGDEDGNLWVLDLVERRVRILNLRGEEVRSLKPVLDPSRLPFPQVFLPLPDGGLLLGGASELWRFDRRGAPVWRLERVFTGVREGLPAFFRVAHAPLREGAAETAGLALYLLDPLGRRLFRFDDAQPAAAQTASELAALLGRLEAGGATGGELVQYALDRGLPLLAQTFLQASMPETGAAMVGRLTRLARVRLLHALVELADLAEGQLRLPEAEAALREAARLTGELRAVDPVEPSYSRDLPGLVARRSRLREELLEPGEQGLLAALERTGPEDGARAILSLRNSAIWPAEEVSVQLRWAGFPPGAGVEWVEPIRPGYTVRLPLPFPPAGRLEGYAEELSLGLSVLVAWKQEGKEERRYLQAAYAANPARDLAKPR